MEACFSYGQVLLFVMNQMCIDLCQMDRVGQYQNGRWSKAHQACLCVDFKKLDKLRNKQLSLPRRIESKHQLTVIESPNRKENWAPPED